MRAPEAELLLAGARLLQARRADETGTLLRGKRLGLVCESDEHADAVLFRRAASALGASVSHILPNLSEPGRPGSAGLAHTARVLGRLYDGIECQGLAPALVDQLCRDAGIPVYDGLATAKHPSAALAELLTGSDDVAKKRDWIVQAVLVATLR